MIFQHKPGQKDNNAWTVVWHGRCIAPVKALVATRNQMGGGTEKRIINWYFFTYLVTLHLHYSCTHFSCVGVSGTPLSAPHPKSSKDWPREPVPTASHAQEGRSSTKGGDAKGTETHIHIVTSQKKQRVCRWRNTPLPNTQSEVYNEMTNDPGCSTKTAKETREMEGSGKWSKERCFPPAI